MKVERIDGVKKASKTPDGWDTGTKYNNSEPKWRCLFHAVTTIRDGEALASSLNRIMEQLARPRIFLAEKCFITVETGKPELVIPSALVEEGYAQAAFARLGSESSSLIQNAFSSVPAEL